MLPSIIGKKGEDVRAYLKGGWVDVLAPYAGQAGDSVHPSYKR